MTGLYLPRLLYGLCLLAAFATSACSHKEDCKLYDTCADSLQSHIDTFAGEKANDCNRCLRDKCGAQLAACRGDVECLYTSYCMLKSSPSDAQDCLSDLYEGNYTRGTEDRYPWEGEKTEFGECLHKLCSERCVEDRFACELPRIHYPKQKLLLSVRTYPDFAYAKNVRVRACEDTTERRCGAFHTTDGEGVVLVPDPPIAVSSEALYLEIEERSTPGSVAFPRTRYYPGRLGSQDLQLLAIYVVSSDSIANGNLALGRERAVLRDVGQSLILPDSCVWDEISASELRITVENTQVSLCGEPGRAPCGDGVCVPCIWYSDDRIPSLSQKQTDGSGGGIVGMADGGVTILIASKDGEPIARRTVQMEANTMTIVRTWPMSASERRARSK